MCSLQDILSTYVSATLYMLLYSAQKYKQGIENAQDRLRSGGASTATVKNSVGFVLDIIMQDCQAPMRQVVDRSGHHIAAKNFIISNDEFHFSKDSAQWVPRLFTPNKSIICIPCQ